ncbi:MAG: bifunctional 5,10-methylene-tetrahydrofolate dehydrogenase/5,10-methylene-tetrahydrofolate cyclohydrolase [Clostridiales bacterium]|jgi:methylenetetrahydrofolate dehydrogenase (NADP+)/methenyltetrahydrofolate cyclohydrolase|nr:bifunctional 5,10-methylene-tetrahydrofolate dehydrogenase/5,10-methylene-tetrahydrofolate cyclohydrolase [Clostridiales bacterium]
MAKLLDGGQVADDMSAKQRFRVETLKSRGLTPTLAVVRVGERPEDLAYERGAVRRCESLGIRVKKLVSPKDSDQSRLMELIVEANETADGVLLFRPLPERFDDDAARNAIDPTKDIDGVTDVSMAGVYSATDKGFAPCTAVACLKMLEFYGYDVAGENITIAGRSLTVGKPLTMLLTRKNATVTMCHTRTRDLPSICRRADIVIFAAGRARMAREQYFSPGQAVIDVGINVDGDGKICGDVDFDNVRRIVEAITPAPGGVGSVTASVLAEHVITATERNGII